MNRTKSFFFLILLISLLMSATMATILSCGGAGVGGDDDDGQEVNDDDDADDDDIDDDLDDDADDDVDDDADDDVDDTTGVFVAPSGDDANPGTMAAPKRTIDVGAALAFTAGKSVYVAAGEYTEYVKTKVSLSGGYESSSWMRDIDVYVTTINAGESTAVEISGSNPVEIHGFTINGGSGDNSYGVHNSNYGTVTIANNVIDGGSGNLSYGVYNDGTTTLMNNVIDGGSPTGGQNRSNGVYNSGTMTLTNNIIEGGSGIGFSRSVFNSGSTTLINNILNGGSGGDYSYGMYNDGGGTATLVNNTIDGGSGSYSHGVLSFHMTTLANNTINSGSGSSYSFGIYNYNVTVALVNNDLWGADMDCKIYSNQTDECEANTVAAVNACAWTGCTEASGNISDDPLFAVDGYHLTDSSPCINTGIDPVPGYISAGFADFDFDGDARPYDAGWDIGADEWTP